MKKMIAAAALAASLMLPGAASAATLVNGGFESSPVAPGTPTGWLSNNPSLVQVVNSFGVYNPVEGNNFAVLTTGAQDVATVLYQQFNLTAGQTVKFAVAFATTDYLPFDDQSLLAVFNVLSGGGVTLFSQSVGAQNPGGGNYNSPWTFVSFTAPTTATYQVTGSVTNIGDGIVNSYLMLDAVPEPGTWMLMLLGFGAIGFSMRRKKNVRVSFA